MSGVCHICRYVAQENKPWCVDCYEAAYAPVCDKCERRVGVEDKVCVCVCVCMYVCMSLIASYKTTHYPISIRQEFPQEM